MRASRRAVDVFRDRPGLGSRAAGVVAVLLLLLLPLPLPGQSTLSRGSSANSDAKLKFHVYGVVRGDPKLAGLNLGVDVERNVAALSGDVPSEALAKYAVDLVGRVLGVAEVRSELAVVAPDRLPPDAARRRTPEGPRTREVPRKTDFAAPDPPSTSPLAGAVSLGTPVPIASSSPRAPAPVRMTAEPTAPPPAPDLAALVEDARQKDVRFRGIKAEVRQGDVTLRGAVARWDHVEDLARTVRHLPGVRKVVLDNVQVERGR